MPARLRIHHQVCGPGYVTRSHLRHGWERVLAGLGIVPFRCRRCGVRFFRPVSRLTALIWAVTLAAALGWGTVWILLSPAFSSPTRAEARQDVLEECFSLTLPAPPCPVADQSSPEVEEAAVRSKAGG